MTSHNDQIRALIAEIDATLEKPSNLLGRLSGEGAKNRETLEHLRDYLSNLQSSMRKARIRNQPGDLASLLGEATLAAGQDDSWEGDRAEFLTGELSSELSSDLSSEVVDGEAIHPAFPGEEMGHAIAAEGAVSAGAIAGGLSYAESVALIQQLGHDLEQLRAGLMAPLRAEVNHLQQQRQALLHEVQQLQRNGALTEQRLQAFLQQLMDRLQEQLVEQVTGQVAQTMQAMQINGNTIAALPLGQSSQRDNRGELMAELVNRLADQMEARGSIRWDVSQSDINQWGSESPASSSYPSIGSASPMEHAHQSSSRRFDADALALDGPEVTLESLDSQPFEAQPDDSTSSAGIARRRILAAQNSESRAQQALERESQRQASRNASSLEDFYASVSSSRAVQQQAMTAQVAAQNRATRPGAIKGHYRNLEDALFDGIPEGDNPWAVQPKGSPQARLRAVPRGDRDVSPATTQYPPQGHRIQALTDLVDQRFDDFASAEDAAQEMPEAFTALYGKRQARGVKKKPFLSLIRPRKSA